MLSNILLPGSNILNSIWLKQSFFHKYEHYPSKTCSISYKNNELKKLNLYYYKGSHPEGYKRSHHPDYAVTGL